MPVPVITKRMGRESRFLKETDSTNRVADASGASGAAEGLLIAADRQTAARGRMEREWFSPGGVNLYCSLVLRPDVEPQRAMSLPLVVGLAVAEALAESAPELQPKIKWPNDIVVNGKKICGILCEMQLKGGQIDYVVAGFGVNVNLTAEGLPPELRETATSIAIETGDELSRGNVLTSILNRFEPLYDEWRMFGFKALAQQVNMLDALCGKPVRMELSGKPIEGAACGIGPDGALLLRTATGLTPVYSGEAHILSASAPF